jgi:uncharacterized protein (UPF0216 family)
MEVIEKVPRHLVDNFKTLHNLLKEKNFEIDKLNLIINSQALELAHLKQIIENYQRLTLNLILEQGNENEEE